MYLNWGLMVVFVYLDVSYFDIVREMNRKLFKKDDFFLAAGYIDTTQ